MKIRNGFVSNSSSSSFVIKKSDLTDIQLKAILKHGKIGATLGMDCAEEYWDIELNKDEVRGFTGMDNFNMYEYLCDFLKLDENIVKWGD